MKNLTSYLYITIGIVALFFALHLLTQIMMVCGGLYFLYKGMSMLQPQPRPLVFMRTMYSRFFGRF